MADQLEAKDRLSTQWFGDGRQGNCNQLCSMRMPFEELTGAIISAFYLVYNDLGPGLPEAAYRRAMMIELGFRAIPYEVEVRYPVSYRGVEVGIYRADLVVGNTVVVELKAGGGICKENIRQVLYYLKASSLPVGMLLNFGESPSFRRITR